MGRHLWTIVAGLVVGIGCAGAGTAAWAQTSVGGPPPSRGDGNSQQRNAADFVNNGRGSVAPGAARDLIHVPSWTAKGPPPGPGGTPGQTIVMTDDPGIWEEKSWVSWWETNRDAVLKRVMARRAAQQPQAAAAAATSDKKPPEEQTRAAAALLKALGAERPALRAAAAVSLGQMRQADALKSLIALAQKDPDAYVRGMAWLAVGLAGGPEAEKALLAVKQPHDEFELLGVIAGIGMLDHPTEPAVQMLRAIVAKPPSPEAGRAAVWALRVFHRPADHDLLLATAAPANGNSPLRSEALLALGAVADARDAMFLADAATDGRASTLPDREVVGGGGAAVQPGGARAYQPQNVSGIGVPPQAPPNQSGRNAANGRTPVARVSAALALGPGASDTGRAMSAGNPRVLNGLLSNFAPYLNQGGPMFGGASVVSFAAGIGPRDVMTLRALLDMGTDPTFVGMVHPKSPLRGYAALGIGLYLANGGQAKIETRPVGSVTVGVDPGLPDFIDLNEVLALRYTNRQESPELRAACALALGLSGDPANVQRLLKGANTIGRDDMLLGYTSLALALLGEKSAANAAGPLVAAGSARLDPEAIATRGVGHLGAVPATPRGQAEASPFDPPPVPQVGVGVAGALGRRAALLALSILGDDPRSEQTLAGGWGRDEATVQDVARALGWRHAYKSADLLTQVVARDQKGAVEAAMSLGWVFDPDRPSRLSRLVVGNNYHQPQVDWVDRPEGSAHMVRSFPRVGDLYLYSTPLGGNPAHTPVRRASTTRPAATPRTTTP